MQIEAPLNKILKKSNALCPVLYILGQMSPVTCHQCQQPQPHTIPPITPPICTLGWITKTEPKDDNKKSLKNGPNHKKEVLSFAILAICSSTRSFFLALFVLTINVRHSIFVIYTVLCLCNIIYFMTGRAFSSYCGLATTKKHYRKRVADSLN